MTTQFTKPHQRLSEILGKFTSVEVEREFPPYVVDCYLPEYHVAFEADGPHHSVLRDERRDDVLMTHYALPVFRADVDTLRKRPEEALSGLIDEVLRVSWGITVDQRKILSREDL